MAESRFSGFAEADLLDIARYTLQRWGEEQTIRYIDDLESCCQELADSPYLGRMCDEIRPGLRRIEHGRHVIFYRTVPNGVLILRILHQRMLPESHSMEDIL